MKLLLLLTLTTLLSAQSVHSSLSTYFESKNFKSSIQKEDGVTYGVGADIHHNNSKYKLNYEYGKTDTKKPPLQEDLRTDKIFARYAYMLNPSLEINFNYIDILHDNIALTAGGKTVGLGLTYKVNKKLSTNFTQFYTKYDDFKTFQSDFRFDYRFQTQNFKNKISSITKYISIDEKNPQSFTKNAKNHYLTTGIKLHSHYKSYHFGAGVYFAKRAFAIMNDGFKIQHHAMEFDRTYALGIGKNISNLILRFQYIYQRATELPRENSNVEVKSLRFIANYKF